MSKPNDINHLNHLALLKEGKCLSTKYTKNSTKYTWQCKNNHTFEASALSISNGSWCKYCYYESRRGLYKGTIEELNKIAEKNGGKCLSVEYKGKHAKYLWQCEFGHQWYATFANIDHNNSWCPECAGVKVLTIEDCQKVAKVKNGECLSQVYTNSKTAMSWQCEKGHKWETSLSKTGPSGHWCPFCGGSFPLTLEECQEFAKKKGGKCLSETYVNINTKMLWQCEKGHRWETNFNNLKSQDTWCPNCFIVSSKAQTEIFEYIKSMLPNEKVLLSDRSAIKSLENSSLELDIYVPSKNFALEYNGLFWHSAAVETIGKVYKKKAHLLKFRACKSVGIKLLAIFEDEWANPTKQELIKAMIKHRLGISDGVKLYARKLELRKLDKNALFKDFFNKYHLDGHSNASLAYGLFLGDEMVSCMSLRTNHQNETEICRFANNFNYRVVGGGGRLINAIKKEIGDKPLITFSNNRLSHGGVYQKLGFTLLQENEPSYYYTDLKVRVWRFKCKRINNPEILERFPTERAQARGGVFSEMYLGHNKPMYEIEDYGHLKWVLK